MAAYFVAHYNILDRSKIDEVAVLMKPIDEKYGAEVIVGSPVKTLEGSAHSNIVIIKFDTFEAAERWYSSPEQKEVQRLRTGITDGWAAILPDCANTEALVRSGYFNCKV